MATKKTPASAGGAPAAGGPKKRAKQAEAVAAAREVAGVDAAVTAPSVAAEAPATVAAVVPTPSESPAVAEAAAPPAPSRDDVARRAYEIWLARGGPAFANWVEAERQLARR